MNSPLSSRQTAYLSHFLAMVDPMDEDAMSSSGDQMDTPTSELLENSPVNPEGSSDIAKEEMSGEFNVNHVMVI